MEKEFIRLGGARLREEILKQLSCRRMTLKELHETIAQEYHVSYSLVRRQLKVLVEKKQVKGFIDITRCDTRQRVYLPA